MPAKKKSSLDSLERKVIESPSLSRLTAGGIFNEGFDSLPHIAISPSFFYIDDTSQWMDSVSRHSLNRNNRYNHRNQDNYRDNNSSKRFTESWIELDRAYSMGSSTSYEKKCCFNSKSSTSSSSSKNSCCSCLGCCTRSGRWCCCSCSTFFRFLVYFLIAITVIGFAAIVSGILYMEIFHKFDDNPYMFRWNDSKNGSPVTVSTNGSPVTVSTNGSAVTVSTTIISANQSTSVSGVNFSTTPIPTTASLIEPFNKSNGTLSEFTEPFNKSSGILNESTEPFNESNGSKDGSMNVTLAELSGRAEGSNNVLPRTSVSTVSTSPSGLPSAVTNSNGRSTVIVSNFPPSLSTSLDTSSSPLFNTLSDSSKATTVPMVSRVSTVSMATTVPIVSATVTDESTEVPNVSTVPIVLKESSRTTTMAPKTTMSMMSTSRLTTTTRDWSRRNSNPPNFSPSAPTATPSVTISINPPINPRNELAN